MKHLEKHEYANLPPDKANEILGEFGRFMQQSIPMYAYESELPWNKNDILLVLLHVLTNATDTNLQSIYRQGILFLSDIIPDPEQYKKRRMVANKARVTKIELENGLTTEEIAEKYKDYNFEE